MGNNLKDEEPVEDPDVDLPDLDDQLKKDIEETLLDSGSWITIVVVVVVVLIAAASGWYFLCYKKGTPPRKIPMKDGPGKLPGKPDSPGSGEPEVPVEPEKLSLWEQMMEFKLYIGAGVTIVLVGILLFLKKRRAARSGWF